MSIVRTPVDSRNLALQLTTHTTHFTLEVQNLPSSVGSGEVLPMI
jgi:hypothetical protein